MEKLRVGIAGIGLYAATTHVPQLRETGRAQVVAAARRSRKRLKLAQESLGIAEAYTDWREMVDRADLDALIVCTPNSAHVEPAVTALEQGLHVLVEKPMATSSEDAAQMLAAAQQADKLLMVGYNARGMGGWRTVKKLLDEETVGTIQQITVSSCIDGRALFQDVQLSAGVQGWMDSSPLVGQFVGDVIAPHNWRSDWEQSGGGTFVDVGTHILDLMLWLAGFDGDSQGLDVAAIWPETGTDWASVVTAQGMLSSGVTFSLDFNDQVRGRDFDFNGQGRLTIYGDRGYLTADWSGFMTTDAQEIWIEVEGERRRIEPSEPTVSPAAAFVAAILDGAPNISPPEQALRVVALTEAILGG